MKPLNINDLARVRFAAAVLAFLRSAIAMALIYSTVILSVATGVSAQKRSTTKAQQAVAIVADKETKALAATQDDLAVSESVAMQIKALDDEKESRTPEQKKIDSQLIYATKMIRGEQIADGVPALEVEVGLASDGFVVVDITTAVDDEVLSMIKNRGGEVLYESGIYQSIRARVLITELETIASLAQVRFIQPKQEARNSQRKGRSAVLQPKAGEESLFVSRSSIVDDALAEGGITNLKPMPNGSLSVGNAASEGDVTHRASTARGTFNVDGTGIKIGVLSDGVTSLADAQASGDLGTVTVLAGQAGSGDEGTAMLEIVHDIAPGAQLYFASGSAGTISQFAQNIRDLRTAGCDIIVDDVGFYGESPFQDGAPGVTNTNAGVVTQAVNDVVADGALFFSAAANSGNKNDNTATTWEGDFISGGTIAVVPGGGLVQDFDPSAAVAQVNIITLGGGTGIPISLSWSDPLGASTNDYDLFVLNNAGTAVSVSSTNIQNGTQDPYEQVGTNNTTSRRVVIRQKPGAAARFMHLGLNGGRITHSTSGEIHGHAAGSGSYGVAATPAFAADNFVPGTSGPYPSGYSAPSSVETFSSDGPRRMFFQGNGTVITPGDVSSTGGQVLQQPSITAADGVQVTGAGAFSNPFFGTSAAAPHAAAIAALIKSANPSFTQAQIKTALTTTAIDIETAGADRDAGFGIVMPYPAMQSLGVTGKAFLEFGGATATETCCNANGLIETGDYGTLAVTLNNPGLLDATGITTTLTSTTLGVQIYNNASAYSDLAATSGTGSNTVPFTFRLNTAATVDTVMNFQLTVNYTGGWNASQVLNFKVESGRSSITTVLDTTAPATTLSFPIAITGTQTNLVFPDDPAGTCASPQAFPGTLTSTTPRFDAYTFTNISGTPACTTITLTADKSALGALQGVAYLGAHNPASVGTNYAADAGFTSIVYPGYPAQYSVNVPAGATLTVVVVELKSPSNGFPTAVGSTYSLKVAGLPVTAVPTAASVSVGGRVTTSGGWGISGAKVRISDQNGVSRTAITNPFGYYRFGDVRVGESYLVDVRSKGYQFSSRLVTATDNLTDVDFEGGPRL